MQSLFSMYFLFYVLFWKWTFGYLFLFWILSLQKHMYPLFYNTECVYLCYLFHSLFQDMHTSVWVIFTQNIHAIYPVVVFMTCMSLFWVIYPEHLYHLSCSLHSKYAHHTINLLDSMIFRNSLLIPRVQDFGKANPFYSNQTHGFIFTSFSNIFKQKFQY